MSTTTTMTPEASPSDLPTKRRLWPWVVATAAAAVIVAGGFGSYWWAAVQLYHPFTVSPGVLYRDGNRGLREFRHAVDQEGIRTVVTLVDDRELNDPAKPQFKQEADYCRAHGISQVRIPVPLGGWPTSKQVNDFLDIVARPTNRPVLVHCAQGVRRTGMFMAAYQLEVLDRTVEYTQRTVQTFGHAERDVADVRWFIDHFDRANSRVPTTLPTPHPE